MIPVKTEAEVQKMRDSCRLAAKILYELGLKVAPGVNTWDLDQYGRELMERYGVKSASHMYKIGNRRFPSYTCLSVNEEVVHGIGNLRRILRPGDIITVDVAIECNGYIGDNAKTLAVGRPPPDVIRLLQVTEEALYQGIAKAQVGSRVGDISNSIQTYVESRGFSIIRDFVGHGVGKSMHEPPQIPNFGSKGKGEKLQPGMTLAIEPMVAMGRPEVDTLADGWTAITKDRLPAAHFEHTVLITKGGPEILTLYNF